MKGLKSGRKPRRLTEGTPHVPSANGTPARPPAAAATTTTTMVEAVDKYMRERCPDLGVDALLTRPLDAIEMAISIAAALKRVRPADAAHAIDVLLAWSKANPGIVDVVNGICGATMNARKRGKFQHLGTRKRKGSR